MRRRWHRWFGGLVVVALSLTARAGFAQYDPPKGGPEKYLDTIKVSDQIYVFKPRIDWTHSNGIAILGPDGVFFIDTFIQFNYAEEAIRRLRTITPLPVRYVLNTHYHTDHVMGNAVFKRIFAECRIIANDAVAARLVQYNKPNVEKEEQHIKDTVALLQSELEKGTATKRNIPLTGRLRTFWEWQLQEAQEYQAQFRAEPWMPVDITFDDTVTMKWGTLTLQLKHMPDNGHSPSDVIVWIPETKVLITGDLDVGPTPYATGPNIPGMISAIRKLIDMKPAIVIPGHGTIQHDTSYLQLLELAFTTYQKAAQDAIAKKVPYTVAADTIAFPDIDTRFTGDDEVKQWAYRAFFARGVIYQTYLAAGVATAAPAAPPAAEEKTASQTYKNIQVLGGIPASQLMPAMFFMEASLGVSCTHCHRDFVDFASDEKPAKRKAREMMRMVESLNGERFGSAAAVTCNTCHRGRATPVAPLAFATPAPAGSPARLTASSLPSVDDLFARYLAATGGTGAWRRVVSLSLTGRRVASEGWTASVEYLAKAQKFRAGFELHGPWASVLNDDDAWNLDNQGVHPLDGRARAVLRLSATVFRPDALRNLLSDLHVTGVDEIHGQQVFVVAGTLADIGQLHLFFNASSGLLARVAMSSSSPFGELPEALELDDYRSVGAVKVPFDLRHLKPDFSTEDRVERVSVNTPIDDSRFLRPSKPRL